MQLLPTGRIHRTAYQQRTQVGTRQQQPKGASHGPLNSSRPNMGSVRGRSPIRPEPPAPEDDRKSPEHEQESICVQRLPERQHQHQEFTHHQSTSHHHSRTECPTSPLLGRRPFGPGFTAPPYPKRPDQRTPEEGKRRHCLQLP